jgi:SAM-dependent methyltransferase
MDRRDWDERYAQAERVWSTDPSRSVVEETDGLPPGRALDLATGEGRDAVWLAERGWKVTGVDFSEVALERAAALAAERGVAATWICADLLVFEPPHGAFDLVLILYLHIDPVDRAGVLARAAAAVRPGGVILVVGHDLENRHGGPSDPALLYTPEAIASELPGLEVERAERVERPVDDGSDRAIDTLVRPRRTR